MILPRLLTVLIGTPLVGMAIYLGGLPFVLLVMGILGVSLREFYLMAEAGGYPGHGWVGTLAGLAWVGSVVLQGPRWSLPFASLWSGLVVTILVVGTVLHECLQRDLEWSFVRLVVTWGGFLYVTWGLSHLLLIRELRPLGMGWTAFLFLLIWAQDIAAYVVGRRFGRHPCSPTLSPQKTWEGAVGGIGAAIATALLCRLLFLRGEMSPAEAAGLGVGLGVLAQVSDLGESLLKRSLGRKDSSNLLPGHGGVLDRFDAFVFTAPMWYYYLLLVKQGN